MAEEYTNTVETYGDNILLEAITRKSFDSCGNEFIDDTVTMVRPYAFYQSTDIYTVILPNATKVGYSAFIGTQLTTLILPWNKITEIDYRAFYGSSATYPNPHKQTSLTLSKLTTLGGYAFANAGSYTSELEFVSAPLLTALPTAAFRYQDGLIYANFATAVANSSSPFEGCTSLKRLRIGGDLSSIPAKLLYGCTAVNTLVLDGVTDVPTVPNTNAFTDCGLASGYVYVPKALVSDFQNDSKWSSFSFRAVEDYPACLGDTWVTA